jgi:hypothetical protein
MTAVDNGIAAPDIDDEVGEDDEQEEAARIAYARAVGARIRAMRKQMRLSLQAVEAMSDQEFKASVLGAYERGERAISCRPTTTPARAGGHRAEARRPRRSPLGGRCTDWVVTRRSPSI